MLILLFIHIIFNVCIYSFSILSFIPLIINWFHSFIVSFLPFIIHPFIGWFFYFYLLIYWFVSIVFHLCVHSLIIPSFIPLIIQWFFHPVIVLCHFFTYCINSFIYWFFYLFFIHSLVFNLIYANIHSSFFLSFL